MNPAAPDIQAIREAAAAIKKGGLVIFPTETVYGLAANALDSEAVRKVFEAKKRPLSMPLPVQVGDRSQLAEVAVELSEAAQVLAERYMPGPITLIVKKNPAIPEILTAGAETLGVRIPDNPAALAFLREFGGPIVATSANLSGQADPRTAEEAVRQIGESVDVVLDAGPCAYGVASTVVDTTVRPMRILRQGVVSAEEIGELVGELVE